jgi:hypothetical protein
MEGSMDVPTSIGDMASMSSYFPPTDDLFMDDVRVVVIPRFYFTERLHLKGVVLHGPTKRRQKLRVV